MNFSLTLGTTVFSLALGFNNYLPETLRPSSLLLAGENTVEIIPNDSVVNTLAELGLDLEASEPIIPAGLNISDNPAEGSRAVIGEDRRVAVTSTSYPWSAVGQISGITASGNGYICTGSLVAEDIVLTNAHCIMDTETGELATNIQFKPNLINGRVASESDIANAEPLLVGTDFSNGLNPDPDDWAFIVLDRSLGQKYGTLGMATIPTAVLADQPFVENLIMAGYSGDFPPDKPGQTASAHVGCSIVGEEVDVVLHLCDTYGGSSGGPILSLVDGEIRIVALNSAEVIDQETGAGLVNIAVQIPRIINRIQALGN
ncbi:trypsin-like peptidase domain-containing protein [Nodosilinea sp. LEGE 07088]|uniref:trypsin-like serine peptidase n=1 Tax=Nodosilinea sp. LEGE 07088 TaxID=2777968 RepID=UPI0018823E5C|nr:trypsin-like peptidase domain-containing protein [Nodosilinea sp. LEGE 07088]MBE9138012.1 trypsin-like peptidase domain-containing protein [Nodosilinea sp. LEGE 07088]